MWKGGRLQYLQLYSVIHVSYSGSIWQISGCLLILSNIRAWMTNLMWNHVTFLTLLGSITTKVSSTLYQNLNILIGFQQLRCSTYLFEVNIILLLVVQFAVSRVYLQAEVSGFPPFPGVEANYLRAMVARIGHATQVAPGGFYTVKNHHSKFGAVPT